MTNSQTKTIEEQLDEILKTVNMSGYNDGVDGSGDGHSCEQAKQSLLQLIKEEKIKELELSLVNIIDSNHYYPESNNKGDEHYITTYKGKCFECYIKDRIKELKESNNG
jgi:hypothetical protein